MTDTCTVYFIFLNYRYLQHLSKEIAEEKTVSTEIHTVYFFKTVSYFWAVYENVLLVI